MRCAFWTVAIVLLVVLCFGAKTMLYALLGLVALLVIDLLLTTPR